jgi:predicted transglutaminase-like cysteine proteinase
LHTVPDCEIRGTDFPRRNIKLTARRWSELNAVNRETNRGIIPEINAARAEWTIGPHAGDCTDYAITKRHQLLMLGWLAAACAAACRSCAAIGRASPHFGGVDDADGFGARQLGF